jgi:hypothetical protein
LVGFIALEEVRTVAPFLVGATILEHLIIFWSGCSASRDEALFVVVVVVVVQPSTIEHTTQAVSTEKLLVLRRYPKLS